MKELLISFIKVLLTGALGLLYYWVCKGESELFQHTILLAAIAGLCWNFKTNDE